MSRRVTRILLVEDEPGLVLTLSDRLSGEGYFVESARDAESGHELATGGEFDLLILDVMLPGKSGFNLCRDLRQQGVQTPILMLTARGQLADKVVGLKLGADDYLTKPFEALELLARVEALLRRPSSLAAARSPDRFGFGQVRVDLRRAEVTRDGEPVEVSAREFQLLRYLIENRGTVLSRDQLLGDVWGYVATHATRTVDVHVARLRQKIEEDPRNPRFLLTVQGLGYKFVA